VQFLYVGLFIEIYVYMPFGGFIWRRFGNSVSLKDSFILQTQITIFTFNIVFRI